MVAAGMSEGALRGTHLAVWLGHAALSLFFIAVIPYSYFVHLVTTPLNIFFSKLTPRGEIRKIDNIEEAEALGISRLEEFSWKRRLDFDACVECGRCQAACPAYMAGTPLSPKQIIVKLKRHMHGQLPGPIHGALIKADELWACTTCMACVQECPAFIDIVDTIIDLLIQQGRIKPLKSFDATVAFHDSCYLGRYNGIMDAPRRVAGAVPGLRVIDPPRARERGLCCGGGGGHMWMEVPSRKRVNVIRVEELLEAKP